MVKVPHIFSADNKQVNLLIRGRPVSIQSSDSRFHDIVTALNSQDWDRVIRLVDRKTAVAEWFAQDSFSGTELRMKGNKIVWGDYDVHSSVADKIVRMVNEGVSTPRPLIMFLQNLLKNPDSEVIRDLYNFLEFGNLPITEDGYFMAYKLVTRNSDGNLVDSRTQKIINNVGASPSMPRSMVERDRNKTCAPGLHVCSYGYLDSYCGDVVVLCKVHPMNVVSIPIDYNQTKMRVCEYTVVDELGPHSKSPETSTTRDVLTEKSVWTVAELSQSSAGMHLAKLTDKPDSEINYSGISATPANAKCTRPNAPSAEKHRWAVENTSTDEVVGTYPTRAAARAEARYLSNSSPHNYSVVDLRAQPAHLRAACVRPIRIYSIVSTVPNLCGETSQMIFPLGPTTQEAAMEAVRQRARGTKSERHLELRYRLGTTFDVDGVATDTYKTVWTWSTGDKIDD